MNNFMARMRLKQIENDIECVKSTMGEIAKDIESTRNLYDKYKLRLDFFAKEREEILASCPELIEDKKTCIVDDTIIMKDSA